MGLKGTAFLSGVPRDPVPASQGTEALPALHRPLTAEGEVAAVTAALPQPRPVVAAFSLKPPDAKPIHRARSASSVLSAQMALGSRLISSSFFFFKIYLKIKLFLAAPGLHCCVQTFSLVAASGGFPCRARAPGRGGLGSCSLPTPELRLSSCGSRA